MMSAAVQGSLFASPGPAPILAALQALGHNHLGDSNAICVEYSSIT